MSIEQIEDVLNLSSILLGHNESDAAHNPSLIADLLAWRDDSLGTVEPPLLPPAPPEPVATQPKSAPLLPPEPEPEVEPEPEPTPVKAAPKSKGRAKPPAPASDDDF